MALPTGLSRQNGIFYVRYKRDGRWTRKSVGRAEKRALELHALLRSGDLNPGGTRSTKAPLRFEKAVELWLEDQRLRNKAKTVKSAEARSKILLGFFRPRSVQSLRDRDLRALIEGRRETVTDVTINAELRILKAILRFAVDQGLLESLPFKIRFLRCTQRRMLTIFTPEEIAKVLEAASPKIRMILVVAATTGLRYDEILHLRWGDIDSAEGRVDVRAKRYAKHQRRGEVVEVAWSTKSYQERSVYVQRDVITELRRYRLSLKRHGHGDWVFQGRRPGERLGHASKGIRKAFEDAGLYEKRKLTHAIRHTVATTLLRNGVDLETLRDVLGHAHLSTTALYLHVSDERKKEAANALNLVSPRK